MMRGNRPTRHQLTHKLLHEQPHLRINTKEFRQDFVIRAVYVVGPDYSTVAEFTGYSRHFVVTTARLKHAEMMRAYRGYVNGFDYEKSVIESIKDVGRTIVRTIQKQSLKQRVAGLAKKFSFKRRAGARA